MVTVWVWGWVAAPSVGAPLLVVLAAMVHLRVDGTRSGWEAAERLQPDR
jgi:hypothetical protein